MAEVSGLDKLQAAVEATRDDLAPDIGLRFRAMFGGRGVYAYDRMFASLSNVGLAVKLSPEMHAAALALPGAKRLQYDESQPVSKDKVVLPEEVVNDPQALAGWVRHSIDFTRSQPEKKRRPPKAKHRTLAGEPPATG